ncbi:MAG: type IV pilus secretin PilQ [Desulfuromonadales bacterium]
MKWKIHTVKNLLLTISIGAVCFVSVPLTAVSAELSKAAQTVRIESVNSTGEGVKTELIIKLTSPATYTSYKTISPLRLVMDFSQVSQGNISEPIQVNKGNFKTVTAYRFDTDAGVLTRLEIGLVSDGDAVISAHPSNPGELKIAFPQLAASELSAGSETAVSNVVAAVAPAVAAVEAAPVAAIDVLTRTLTSITVKDNTIVFALDGGSGDFKTFRLNNPERFVVDLMNVKSGLSTRLLPLNASGIASARIGLYPDKVRVVLDAVNGSFPEASAARSDSGVIITLDAKPLMTPETKPEGKPAVVKQAVPEIQPAVVADKTIKSFGHSTVEMIDFQVIDDISRITIKVNGDINVEPPLKTPGYVSLTIKNTTLPKNLQRSLETRNFISPVLRITPLAVKTKKGTDSKVRIATRVASPFEYRQEGDMIFIDFKHPEGMNGDKLFIEATDYKKASARQKTEPVPDKDFSTDLSPAPDSAFKSSGTSGGYKGRKVTLEFADAEVRKIFQLLAEVSNKNFVLGDDVTGTISIKLVNVPWDQALDIILDTKNLDKREDGNILLIKGKGKFKSQAEEDLEIKKTAAKSIELKTETFSVNYADLAAITSQFEKLKTPDRGQIASDARTSKVIVKDTPQALNDMRVLLSQLDLPERQVMIEARIIEATSSFSRSLGVSWGVHYRDGSASVMNINSMDTSFGGLTSAPPVVGIAAASGAAMGISFGKLASNLKVDARLNAAAGAGMIKIISSPKVATLNHKPAKISQGQQIPYQNTTSTAGAVTAFVAATLSLEVTPHINANGTIMMKIDAKNDAPGTGSPPPINTKQATTEMLLRDGETTVIGGIFVDSDTEGDDGVPFLMDIPYLGKLFKSNTKTKIKTELLIFITPRILDSV